MATEAIGGGRGVEVFYSTCADATAERTAPMAMLIYSLVIIGYAREGHRHWQPADKAWYADFPHQSTTDRFFTEEQFEAYRRLGKHIADGAMHEIFAGAIPDTYPRLVEAVGRYQRFKQLCIMQAGLEPVV